MEIDKLKLTEDQQKHVVKWLEERRALSTCVLCGHDKLEASEHIGAMVVADRSFIPTLDQIVPCVSVACLNCGHLYLFSAMMMGLKPHQEAANAS